MQRPEVRTDLGQREGPCGWKEKSEAEAARHGLREDVRAASHRAVGGGRELSCNLQAVEGTGWF